MTPVSHFALGAAGGGILSPVFHKYFKLSFRAAIVLFSIGAIAPDVDSLSLVMSWEIYHGKKWYSHHFFAHSLLGITVLSAILALLYLFFANIARGLVNLFRRDKIALEYKFRKFLGAWLAAWLGCGIHLLGDVVTPPGPWKGIALFWPSKEMTGGWSWIYWHNWYLIYMSLVFTPIFMGLHFLAGLVNSVKHKKIRKFSRWPVYALRVVAFGFSAFFIFQTIYFIKKNDYSKMGYRKWTRMNIALSDKRVLAFADRHSHLLTIFFKKRLLKRGDIINGWNKARKLGARIQRRVAPFLYTALPEPYSDERNMQVYRALQRTYPGMGDKHRGRYRMWIFRNARPDPTFFDRGITYYLVHKFDRHTMQITNARIVVFRIDEYDSLGKARRVSRIFESDKVYVPDVGFPQINRKYMKHAMHQHWRFSRVAYNSIPGLDYSRYMNMSGGFFPSLEVRTGVMEGRKKTGVYLHSGVWSEGCLISVYGHMNIGQLLQYPFFNLWETADEYINIKVRGVRVRRGQTRFWGRMMMVRDPEPLRI